MLGHVESLSIERVFNHFIMATIKAFDRATFEGKTIKCADSFLLLAKIQL